MSGITDRGRSYPPPLCYFMDWRKSGGTGARQSRNFSGRSIIVKPYLGMEEEVGLEGADLALLESTNGRAMMKYMRIMISES